MAPRSKSQKKSSEEDERFDPYAHSTDPEVEARRARLRESIALAERQWDYQMSRARRREVGYAVAAKNALAIYDNTIAASKR